MLPARFDSSYQRPTPRSSCAVFVAGFALLLPACGSAPTPPRPLDGPGELPVSGQAVATTTIAVPADMAVRLRLRPRGVDVRAELEVTEPRAAIKADAPGDRVGVITFFLPPGPARTATLRVIGEDHASNRGSVAVELVSLPSATAADRRQREAEQHFAAACTAYADVDRARAAVVSFAAAAERFHSIGDRTGEGVALLQQAAALYLRENAWEQSRGLALRAERLLAAAGERELAVRALRLQGAAMNELAGAMTGERRAREFVRARECLGAAARRAERLGLPYEAAYAFNYRGVAYQYEGSLGPAEADFERALGLFRAAGHRPGMALSNDSLALLHYENGEVRQSLQRFDEALALSSPGESPVNYAVTLSNSALPLRVLGRFDEAVTRYQRSAELLRAAGDPAGEIRAMQGIAVVLLHAGAADSARVLLQEVIRRSESSHRNRELTAALGALAEIERDAGHADAARALLARALPLAGSASDQARVLSGLLQVAQASGRATESRRYVEQILDLGLPPTHRALTMAWQALAQVEGQAGHEALASRAFDRALAIADARGSELERSAVFTARARHALDRWQPGAALRDTQRAIDLLESSGAAAAYGQQRAEFVATRRRVYELQIAAYLALAQAATREDRGADAQRSLADALVTSERSRMTGLLAELAAPQSAAATGLLQRREILFERLAGKRQRLDALLDASNAAGETVQRLAQDIALLRADLVTVEAAMARGDGRSGRVGAPDARALLAAAPAQTLVCEYFVGESRAWLFVVHAGRVAVHELAAPRAIEDASARLLAQWTSPDADADAAALDDWRGIFPSPLVRDAASRGIWIVADGPLHAVPLAALASRLLGDAWSGRMVVEVVPSLRAVALAASRTRRTRSAAAPIELAMFADPVYTPTDPRIAAAVTHELTVRPASAAQVAATPSARWFDSLQRLPATAGEARAITALLPATRTLTRVGPDATREAVLDAQLGDVRYLHFATHAFADTQDPELSALVLSRYSADGTARSGVLRMHDLGRLRLSADLVVLSGCETGLGRSIRGEGVVGLAHGFLQAGAHAVLASLWRVPDTSTAALMAAFYRHLLVEHEPPARALRHAQDHVRSQARWSKPYYWAGFQLVTVKPDANANTTQQQGERLP